MAEIKLTSTEGLALTLMDALVIKGEDGLDGLDGADGLDGVDGVSPTVSVEEIEGGHRVTITDCEGEHVFDVTDGADGSAGYDFDAEPTEGSGNLVTSGGIYSYVRAAIFEAMEASY